MHEVQFVLAGGRHTVRRLAGKTAAAAAADPALAGHGRAGGCGGGHAVVCYGWNETGLLIQNSWGAGWGIKGCFIIPYEYGFTEAWVIAKDPEIIVKPTAFWLRELLVAIGKFFERLFAKKS